MMTRLRRFGLMMLRVLRLKVMIRSCDHQIIGFVCVHSMFLSCVLVGLALLPALVLSASVETRSPVAQAGVMQRFDSDCTAVFIHCFCCACWCCDMRFILHLSYYMLGLIAGVSNYAKNKSSCCVYPGLHFYVQRRVQMYAK